VGKHLLRYGLMVAPPLIGLYIILHVGKGLAAPQTANVQSGIPALTSFNAFSLANLLLQIGVILIAARVVGQKRMANLIDWQGMRLSLQEFRRNPDREHPSPFAKTSNAPLEPGRFPEPS
jgi:hypothetical protein